MKPTDGKGIAELIGIAAIVASGRLESVAPPCLLPT